MVRLASPLAPEDPAKFCNIFLRLASCTSACCRNLFFLSAGTCVVGPQAGLVVVPVEEFVAWMVLALPGVAKLSLTLLEEVLQGLVHLLV